jgi:hypothetical protein
MALQFFLLVPVCFFSFLILFAVGRIPLTGDQPVTRRLPTHRINAHGTCTDIHAFERVKTVHALDSAATVIGAFSVDGTVRRFVAVTSVTVTPCNFIDFSSVLEVHTPSVFRVEDQTDRGNKCTDVGRVSGV